MSPLRSLSTLAVTCPGQGIVARGCLHGVRQYVPLFQSTLDCVDQVFGEKVSSLFLEEPPRSPDVWSLSTANAQPAIVAAAYALVKILRKRHGVDLVHDHRVSYFLGHSLGEYTALLLLGVLTLEQTLGVVRKRGLLMEKIVGGNEYQMRVLMFRPLDYERVHDVTSKHGVLACVNSASQILVSGLPSALDSAINELNSLKRTILKQATLPVKVPFHNEVLRGIEPELGTLGAGCGVAKTPIISNYSGQVSEGDLFQNTVRCNSAPVQWKASMEFLERVGIEAVVNLGPGNAIDVINGKYNVRNIPVKTADDMQRLAERLRG